MKDFTMLLLFLVLICVVLAATALLFVFIINSISNTRLRKIVIVLLTIFFMPVMLVIWSSLKLTDAERRLAPFSLSLHTRSRLVLLSLVVYIVIYYFVFNTIL